MNSLASAKRVQVIAARVEGSSIDSISRMTGLAKRTILKLLEDKGCACAAYHHRRARRIQCDEIRQFVGAKAENVTPEKGAAGWGDAWKWVALDADSKLCISFLVGGRDTGWATDFAFHIRQRVVGHPQITTDAHRPYLAAIEMAFGDEVDYAQMHKIYGASDEPETRYSPATCVGCDMKTVIGSPDDEYVSTSFAERQNLTMRMSMRRFARLTNGFSKRIENHSHAVALHFMHYNLCRIHRALRVTPAMGAGLADHVWSLEELVYLLLKDQRADNLSAA